MAQKYTFFIYLKLIEPLKEFFKDEVRILGKSIGLIRDINYKHPFPGPGLGIRIIGNITSEKIKILQEADDIYIKELIKNNFPEIEIDKVSRISGMDITFVSSAKTDMECKALLQEFGMPFKK